jgi:hypothetical protein
MNSVAGSSQQLGPNTAGDAATPIAAGTAWSASMANKTASTAHRVRSGRGKRELDTVELRKFADEALADLRTPTSSPTEAQLRIPTIAAIDSDRNQPPVPTEASRGFR